MLTQASNERALPPDQIIEPGDPRDITDGVLRDIEHAGGRAANAAVRIRDNFKTYFNSEAGSVSWQDNYAFGQAN